MVGVLVVRELSRPAPARHAPIVFIPPDVPVDAPPPSPDIARDETREAAARNLGALDSFVLTRGDRTLWAFVLEDEWTTGCFLLRLYEHGDDGEWRMRTELATLSVRPEPVDGDPSRLVTAMRMSGADVPFVVFVTDDDVRFEPGDGYFMVPSR